MNRETRDQLFKWYQDYVNSFIDEEGKLHPMKKLKLEHSMRVTTNAKKIAEYSGWSKEDIYLAEICGLMHDVARYSQFKNHRTFQDHRSINHAEEGYKILKQLKPLDILAEQEKHLVLTSTRLHNVKVIPDNLNEEEMRYLTLVRDCDKLDIYHVIHDAVINDKLGDYPEVTHGVEIDGPPTDSIVEAVKLHQPISYEQTNSLSDFLLILVQWTYEMNFAASYKIMAERNILEMMQGILPLHNPGVRDIIHDAKAFLKTKV